MRPGYLVVGTKRGGSTSLAEWINLHPQVVPCRNNKGSRFFDINYRRGPAWYFSRFERPGDHDGIITGEASPYYMYHPAAPERMAKTLPDVKLIAVLRDPVERAWSQYRYEVSRGNETESFDRALDLEPERLRGERERLETDPSYEGFDYRHHGYLERGHYADQLAKIYKFFPETQVLVLQSERLFAEPHVELSRVWGFLGLDNVTLSGLQPLNAGATRASLDDHYRTRLTEYFRPHNERLWELLGTTFDWDVEERGT